ncbi:MAG TPA: DUF4215 domain-containing protein [Polyangiaceae bacterium]|nr:DUF4215 domain-containing protein [Polyangiaceae bacterium]
MKRGVALIGMVLVAAEAADVHAQVLRGSDIMNKLTDDIVAQCPGATGIDYQGGGTAGGENRLANGIQQVAPMSRFISASPSTVCTFPDTSTAEALNVAGERTAVLTNAVHGAACDPGAETTCNVTGGIRATPAPLFPACGAIGGDWRHVLRLLYFGLNCSDGQNPTGVAGIRNCLDPDRLALVNNWGSLFENPSPACSGGGGGGTLPGGNCVELRHAFRRDEQSSTTDAFRTLLGVSARTGISGYPFCNDYPLESQGALTGAACLAHSAGTALATTTCPIGTSCQGWTAGSCTAGTCTQSSQCGTNGTCNGGVCTAGTCSANTSCGSGGGICTGAASGTCQLHAGATCGNGTVESSEECDDGNTLNFDGCSAVCLKEPGASPACSGELTSDLQAGAPALPSQTYTDAYIDGDPIRRTCSGTFNVALGTSSIDTKMAEEVCSRDGTLGLVLPVSVPVPDGVAIADLPANVYPKASCRQGRFVNGSAPVIKSGVGAVRRFGLCPDGRTPRNTWWDTAERLARPGRCTAGACSADSDCGVGGGSCTAGVCTSGNCGADSQCGTSGGSCAVSAAATCPIPATETNDARCINAKNNKPSTTPASFPTPGCVVPAASIDGRAFNLTLRTATGGLHKTGYNGTREVIGAFHRLHTTRTLLGSGAFDLPGIDGRCDDGVCCDALDSSQQVACLVSVSSCSIGFAQRHASLASVDAAATPAVGNDPSAHAHSVNLTSASQTVNCPTYPFVSPRYLGTLMGFENTTGTERALAQCFSGVGLNSPHSITSMIYASDFTPWATGPFCQDFTAEATCGDTPADACANNPAGIACQDDDDCAAGLTCIFSSEPGGLTKGNCQ